MTSNIAGEGGRPLPAAELERFFSLPTANEVQLGLKMVHHTTQLANLAQCAVVSKRGGAASLLTAPLRFVIH